jgi:hypothetical protein
MKNDLSEAQFRQILRKCVSAVNSRVKVEGLQWNIVFGEDSAEEEQATELTNKAVGCQIIEADLRRKDGSESVRIRWDTPIRKTRQVAGAGSSNSLLTWIQSANCLASQGTLQRFAKHRARMHFAS